jgi:hypothetical protein
MPALVEMEKQLLLKLLKKHGGDKRAVAAELGVCLKTLYAKLKKFGVGNVRALVRAKPALQPAPEPEPPLPRSAEPPTPAHPHAVPGEFAARIAEQIAVQLEAGHIDGARRTLEVEWQRHLVQRVPLTAAQILALPLASTELPLRLVNALEQMGILTLGQLLHTQPEALLSYRRISAPTLKVIRAFAAAWAERHSVALATQQEANSHNEFGRMR